MNIIISAGGSGGHIYPALEILSEFKRREKNLNVLYIGTHNRMEKNIVPNLGIPYEELEIYGFTKDIKRDIKNVFLMQKALKKCKKIMQEFKPDIVIGVGGYVTYPVIKTAHKMHIKCVLHEQNSRPGKVNFLVSRYADMTYASFKNSMKYLGKAKKVVYTGHPSLDKGVLASPADKTYYGLHNNKKMVLYVAGSLGSISLNEKMIDFLNSSHDYEILYITGNSINVEEFQKKVKNNDVKIIPYVEDLPALMKSSDVVISRAGAGSLFEIIGTNSPSIIIPSPNVSNNHQYYNALELLENKAIVLLEEKNITKETLEENISDLLTNKAKVAEMKKNMKKYQNIKPCDAIYNYTKEVINSGK